jgi:hypothetical protein
MEPIFITTRKLHRKRPDEWLTKEIKNNSAFRVY